MTKPKPSRSKSPKAAVESDDQRDESAGSFSIVGVGASAGGLEAYTELLKNLPLDTGMGFVLVQHLDPQHESSLVQILARATSLPVHEITNKLRVEPNHIYVIPPDKTLVIEKGALKLQPRAKTRTAPHPIDAFFESLAEDQRDRAIGVVLSGTATDGTLGLEAIKAEGGITFAQDDSARYDSMPRSAIAAGCVDFILSPQNIAKELARIAKHPFVAGLAPYSSPEDGDSPEEDRADATAHEDDQSPLPSGGSGAPPTGAKEARAEAKRGSVKKDTAKNGAENGFRKILLALRNHSGVDFSLYKSTTIQRRITRRMILSKQETLEDYAASLRGNAKELDALYSDVLISVTSFFRNPEAFDILKHEVFPTLLKQRSDDPFRVWVLGCSTGQEAYSIAMAFSEAAEKAPRLRKLQIYATDLNNTLLDKARHGLYAKSLADDVSPERLRRFFVEEEGGYRVVKSLREVVVFARQNLISDPPFSRMNLISCRNLLIYLEPSLQKKALPTFHYALKPDGFLFLGASESIGGFGDLFEVVDKKHKIYSKKAAPTVSLHLPVKQPRGEQHAPGARPPASLLMGTEQRDGPDGFRGELNAQREADRVTVNQFAPPSVLINDHLQILQFRGPTGAYLEPPTGKASFDVLKMAREGLMLPLRAAINKAKKENKTVRKENVRVKQNGGTRTVNVEVIPLKNLRERCFLILFEEAEKSGGRGSRRAESPEHAAQQELRPPRKQAAQQELRPPRKHDSRRVGELESELYETRDYLQSIQEQNEAANEELQASNEEVQSANEELQSINEELETSKEELESTNEELTTINEEMGNRNAELNRLNNDLTNIQTSIHLAVVLVGRDLAIRRFSLRAEKQFNLLSGDVGRPIGNIRHNLKLPDLETFITEVIDTVRERVSEVQDKEGRWYSLRVRPYMTLDNKVDGAVVVLVDIDELKRTEQTIAAARDYAESIVQTVRDPLVVLSADLRVETANEAFYALFKVSPKETEGKLIYDLGGHLWDTPKFHKLLEDILPRNSFFNNFEVTHEISGIGRRTVLLNARTVITSEKGRPAQILLGIQDVTELLQFQAEVRRSEIRYRRLFEAAHGGVLIIDPATQKILDANPFMTGLLGYTHKELLGKELFEIGLLKDEASSREAFQELQAKGVIRYDDLPLVTKAGERREVEFVSNLYNEEGKRVVQCNIRDITDRKRAEEATARLAAIVASSDDAIISKNLNGVITSWNQGAEHLFGYSAKEAIGKPVTQFIPEDHLDEEPQILERIRQGQVIQHFETVRLRKDGSLVDISLTVSPLKDADGRIIGASKIARDITDRKRAEESLREGERRFRQMIDALPAAVYTTDAEGRLTHFNPAAVEFSGRTPELGSDEWCVSWKLYHPDGSPLPHDQCPMAIALKEGRIVRGAEAIAERPDGTRVWFTPYPTPLRDAEGRIVGGINMLVDITERKQAEAAMRESEERYRNLFNSMDEGYCIIEMIFDKHEKPVDYRFLEVNPAFENQSGMHDVIGKRMLEFVSDIEGHWLENYGNVAVTGEPIRFANEYKTLGRWFDVYAFRVDDPDSRRVAVLFTDITEERQMADELRRNAADLSEADRRKNEFLAMLAHELRNPLAPIRNALQIMRFTDSNGDSVQSASEMMERQVSQMVRLVDDLLDVSRISRGKIELRRGRIELASSVHHAVEAVRPVCDNMNHELVVALPPEAIYLEADPARLIQVVGNLLNNACKFTDNGGRVTLTVERDGEEAVIRVRDTGIGIAAEKLPRIFDMFTQVDASMERSHGGLGIGLTLVKNLVELHGGSVEVHSAGVGQGSEFMVRLPILVEAAEPPPKPILNGQTLMAARRILVVDDNRDSAESLALLLKMTGNETQIAYDGLEAVEAAAEFKPDMVLLDIGLPKMNGYEVAAKIREQPEGKKMTLVALTGWGQDEDLQRSKDAGFNGHMVKPVEFDELMKLMAELLPSPI